MTTTPNITVGIPTYNQDPHVLNMAVLSAAMQSVSVEVIVVDDGSTNPVTPDNWPENVRLERLPENKGVSTALNKSIELSKDDWWCWLSSDDLMYPDKCSIQLDDIKRNKAFCGYHPYLKTYAGKPDIEFSMTPIWENKAAQNKMLFRDCWINGSTVMIHRSVFDEVGVFDPSYRFGQDWEMWCRIGHRYKWHCTPKILGARRDGNNLTESIERDEKKRTLRDGENLRIIREYSKLLNRGGSVENFNSHRI